MNRQAVIPIVLARVSRVSAADVIAQRRAGAFVIELTIGMEIR
jgi:hypothetical protein